MKGNVTRKRKGEIQMGLKQRGRKKGMKSRGKEGASELNKAGQSSRQKAFIFHYLLTVTAVQPLH